MTIIEIMRNLPPIQTQTQHPSLPNSIVPYVFFWDTMPRTTYTGTTATEFDPSHPALAPN
jgi:hypothetical protein